MYFIHFHVYPTTLPPMLLFLATPSWAGVQPLACTGLRQAGILYSPPKAGGGSLFLYSISSID